MQAIMEALNERAQAERARYQLCLGELIKRLERADPGKCVLFDHDAFVKVGLGGLKTVSYVGSPHSYRGHYCDLALEPSEIPRTTGELAIALREVLDRPLTGYKGGKFVMKERTPVWVSHYDGASGMAIMDTQESENAFTLKTKYIED